MKLLFIKKSLNQTQLCVLTAVVVGEALDVVLLQVFAILDFDDMKWNNPWIFYTVFH